ncbi:Pr6Pr family membrane protein [Agromyces sp. NPDC058110]|uniref:Pr6Pr family membrane protein n=1 Tax=Agromyces sp. NPDC058110 TaxID=3346345 RepID=UPI0036DC732B
MTDTRAPGTSPTNRPTHGRAFALAWAVLRVAVAVAIIAAIVVTYQGSSGFWRAEAFEDLVTLNVNFFSYFTIESNLLATVVLLIGAGLAVAGRLPDPGWFAVLRACATTYMAITGIVYNLLLRGIPVTGGGDSQPWTNEVMHVVAPVFLVLDWLLAPGRRRLEWSRIWVILAFPIVWVAYTLLRGPLVFDQVKAVQSWYPYPFLNPAVQANGYLGVAFWVVVISCAFAAVASLVVWVSRLGRPTPEGGTRDDATASAAASDAASDPV